MERRGLPGFVVLGLVAAMAGLGGACSGDAPASSTPPANDTGVGQVDAPGADVGADVGGEKDSSVAVDSGAGVDSSAPDTSGPTPDAVAADTATTDVAVADTSIAACDLAKPFGPPTLVPGVNLDGADQSDARLSPDELTVYFGRGPVAGSGVGDWDIWVAQRAKRTDPFGAPKTLANVDTAEFEAHPSVSDDQKTMFLTVVRGAGASADLFVATRTTVLGDFGTPVAVTGLASTSASESQPFFNDAQKTLYFSSNRSDPTKAQEDVFRVSLAGSTVGTPEPVAEINTPTFSEFTPTLSADGLRIFWASTRNDGGAKGSFDVWTATRTSTTSSFSSIANVSELNTDKSDAPSWLSPDGCRLYLSSNRGGRSSIYMAERPK